MPGDTSNNVGGDGQNGHACKSGDDEKRPSCDHHMVTSSTQP